MTIDIGKIITAPIGVYILALQLNADPLMSIVGYALLTVSLKWERG